MGDKNITIWEVESQVEEWLWFIILEKKVLSAEGKPRTKPRCITQRSPEAPEGLP